MIREWYNAYMSTNKKIVTIVLFIVLFVALGVSIVLFVSDAQRLHAQGALHKPHHMDDQKDREKPPIKNY